jgi:hypothetical protein
VQATLEAAAPVSEVAPAAKRPIPLPLVLAAPAILVALLLVLPFLGKAFAVDDPIYLSEAAQALRDFRHPLHFDLCWLSENVCAPAAALIPNVTLIAYFLLPAAWLGSPEWLVHLMQFGALCVGIVATVSIALRMGYNRMEAALAGTLVAAFPPVLAYTNGGTPDILAMALGAAGMERLLVWRQDRRLSAGVLAGVLLGLAPLARPHLLILIAVATLPLAAGRRIRALWPVALAGLIAGAGLLAARDAGQNVDVVPGRLMAADYVLFNSVSYFWYLIVPFPVGLAWMMGARWRGAAVLAAATGLFLALTGPGRVNGWVALVVICAGCGALAVLAIIYRAARERSGDVLLLAAWSAIPLAVLAYVHLPPKYLFAGAPAIAILIVLCLRRSAWPRACTGGLIACCLVLSWLTLRADNEFADKARLATRDLLAPPVAAGRNVWFTGEWGIYWYAQRAGARVLKPYGRQPAAGDLLLIGAEGAASGLDTKFPHRTLIARRKYQSQFGRTMSHEAGAGLHSNVVGPFVWSPRNGNLDSYELWRID